MELSFFYFGHLIIQLTSECCENDREKRSGVQNGGDIGWIGLSEAPFDIQEALAKRRSGDNVLHNRLRKRAYAGRSDLRQAHRLNSPAQSLRRASAHRSLRLISPGSY